MVRKFFPFYFIHKINRGTRIAVRKGKKHRRDCLPKSSDLCTRIRRVTHEDGRHISVSVHHFVSRSVKRKTGIPVRVYFLHIRDGGGFLFYTPYRYNLSLSV